jgi:hypothetical protein
MYRIAWRHLGSGKSGRSIPLFSSLRVALKVAVEMDKTWPERQHHVEKAEPSSAARAAKPGRPEWASFPDVPGLELARRLASQSPR